MFRFVALLNNDRCLFNTFVPINPDRILHIIFGKAKPLNIVQKCYESVCKHSNQKIILLNDQNLADYIRLPDYIEKKKDTGQIPIARYADLMKFAILEHYGGTWIDSTVYLTDPIPDMILNSDFFAVRNSLLLIDNPVLYPAWFLHAKKGNKTIREIRNVAFAYCLKKEHIIEYLLPNLIITLAVKSNPEVEQAIPYMNSDYSEYLVKAADTQLHVL